MSILSVSKARRKHGEAALTRAAKLRPAGTACGRFMRKLRSIVVEYVSNHFLIFGIVVFGNRLEVINAIFAQRYRYLDFSFSQYQLFG